MKITLFTHFKIIDFINSGTEILESLALNGKQTYTVTVPVKKSLLTNNWPTNWYYSSAKSVAFGKKTEATKINF